jgi:hypothetical protein
VPGNGLCTRVSAGKLSRLNTSTINLMGRRLVMGHEADTTSKTSGKEHYK